MKGWLSAKQPLEACFLHLSLCLYQNILFTFRVASSRDTGAVDESAGHRPLICINCRPPKTRGGGMSRKRQEVVEADVGGK